MMDSQHYPLLMKNTHHVPTITVFSAQSLTAHCIPVCQMVVALTKRRGKQTALLDPSLPALMTPGNKQRPVTNCLCLYTKEHQVPRVQLVRGPIHLRINESFLPKTQLSSWVAVPPNPQPDQAWMPRRVLHTERELRGKSADH